MIKIMSQKRSSEEATPNLRYTRIRLASPSPERTSDSDTESIHSVQGYGTETVKDTSDTSSPPPSQLNNIEFEMSDVPSHSNNIEYEVTNVEENKVKYYFSEESDGKDFETYGSSIGNESSDETVDDASFGDTSEENSTSPTSNSDVDPGLPRNDYLDFEKCMLCKTDKKDISYPYCSACFDWKKRFFPNRPKKYKKNVKKKGSFLTGPKKKSRRNRSKAMSKRESTKSNESSKDGLCEDSGVGSSEAQQSEDIVDGPSTSGVAPSNFQNASGDNLCKVCYSNLENGLFVHLKIAHLYGCYNCANKIWYHTGACPICRRKVFKIIKLLI